MPDSASDPMHPSTPRPAEFGDGVREPGAGMVDAKLFADVTVRLARSPAEIRAAQRLRYEVFFSELGAKADAVARTEQRDAEALDDIADHLIVVDHRRTDKNLGVVGTYRLLRGDARPAGSAFYSEGEFNIERLVHSRANLLELGRSCVLRDYRQRQVLQLLWKALAVYVAHHRIEIMFGCASFHGTDPARIEQELSYLHHYHLVRPALRPSATGPGAITTNRLPSDAIEVTRVLRRLPPLIRGYLQLGAKIGLDAYVDAPFNAIDVCVVLPTADLAAKYVRHYARQSDVELQPTPIRQDA
jgi:putative hemolysin